MSNLQQKREPASSEKRWFTTTHWSVVLAAGHDSSPGAQEALEKLCRTYWYPLYAYVRQRGHEPHDAQDLTQEFFLRLLDKHYLAQVDRRKGKFRSFLMVAVNHFLANEWDRAKAAKRGGRVAFIPFEEASPEQRYALELVTDASLEKIFERRWALVVLDQVLAHLRDEFARSGKIQQFESLKMFLTGEKPSVSYAELAARLQTTEAALKMAVKRMRRRCAELLREEVAHTVDSPEQVEEEIRCLFAAMGA
ncbi:MAG: RNA polymerase subunit sigma-24 [Verrucomicrobia bacterium]|nr:MAG: RNA polymerase subunit sigma-24 [Verrucomicrobiota bacterium]